LRNTPKWEKKTPRENFKPTIFFIHIQVKVTLKFLEK